VDLLHETVRHVRFGAGTVTSFDGRVMTVAFESAGERVFSYPAAFERFIEADNPDVQAEAEAALSERRAREAQFLSRVEQDIETLRSTARKKSAPAPRRRAPARRSKAQL